jgi:acyl-CoA thioesterase
MESIHDFDHYRHPDNFGAFLGYRVVAFDRKTREARVALTVREDHLSPARKVHGGVISALLDYTCGTAAGTTLAKEDLCSTVELKVNYFRPLGLGDELEASARVVFRGRKLCALTAFLHRKGEADPVAMATATFNVVKGAGSDAASGGGKGGSTA